MEENKMEETKKEELSYEELKNVAIQLQQRCAMLEKQLKGIDLGAIRLNYLFKVVKYKEAFPVEFAEQCIKEVQEMLTIEEVEEPKEV